MPARVKGLGHVGLYVRDLEVMKEFWGGFMGMTLTKCSEKVAIYPSRQGRSEPGRTRPALRLTASLLPLL